MGFQAIMELVGGGAKTFADTNAASTSANIQAGADSTNAELARMQATDATARGERDAELYGKQFSQAFGQREDQEVGSHVDATFGSALNSLNDMRKGGALDELTIRNDAANKALGFTQEANNYDLQAQGEKAKSAAAVGSGLMTGGLQLLNFGKNNAKSGGTPDLPPLPTGY